MEQKTVATPTIEALYMADERKKMITLLSGTQAMRDAGETYLPRNPAEDVQCYKFRLSVSTLYNGTRKTVKTLAGKPFSQKLKLSDNMPEAMKPWFENIDLSGRKFHDFAYYIFQTVLSEGITHILSEYPTVTEEISIADKQQQEIRPYLVNIKHDQILGWKSKIEKGQEVLTQLRFMEQVAIDDGDFDKKFINQVRVLEPNNWRIFRQSEKGDWYLFDEGIVTLGKIPLSTAYGDREGFMMARPPLLDLGDLNIEHWQSSSEQQNILHVARVPILFGRGINLQPDESLKVGAGAAVLRNETQADLKYVEHTGAAIEAGRQSIKDLEERMALMGAQLLVKKTGTQTATEKAIDTAEADSELANMARNLEGTLNQAIQFMADWENIPDAGTVELTGEIGGLEQLDVDSLLKAQAAKILSRETVFLELKRRGILADEAEWLIEAARINQDLKDLAASKPLDVKNNQAA